MFNRSQLARKSIFVEDLFRIYGVIVQFSVRKFSFLKERKTTYLFINSEKKLNT